MLTARVEQQKFKSGACSRMGQRQPKGWEARKIGDGVGYGKERGFVDYKSSVLPVLVFSSCCVFSDIRTPSTAILQVIEPGPLLPFC